MHKRKKVSESLRGKYNIYKEVSGGGGTLKLEY